MYSLINYSSLFRRIPDLLRLVIRVLSHVRITCNVGNRDRIYVELRLDTDTSCYTSLEVPKILGTREETKADQIRTTATFYVELTTPLVNQSLFIDSSRNLLAISTLLDSLDICESMLDCGAIGACMSGSGPTTFGIFVDPDEAQEAYDLLKERYPDTFMTGFSKTGLDEIE